MDGVADASSQIKAKVESAHTAELRNKDRGISFNHSCSTTARMLQAELLECGVLANVARPALLEQQTFQQVKGASPEQLAEIARFFGQFDSGKSGAVDAKHARALVFLFGEDPPLPKARADALLAAALNTSDGKLTEAQYRALMVEVLCEGHTRENILAALQHVARSPDKVTKEALSRVLPTNLAAFLLRTAPPTKDKEGSVKYVPWVDEVFAR